MTGYKFVRGELPPIRDVAAALHDGATIDDLCTIYGVEPKTLANRLSYAGYGTDGHPIRVQVQRDPLRRGGEGSYVSGGVGGGDYDGLPVVAVLHTRRERRVFVGLDWSTSPASGPRWVWV